MRDVHIVCDQRGAIVAVADAAEITGPGGIRLGHRPVPSPGYHVVRLPLEDQLLAGDPRRLFREFEIDLSASSPTLRQRELP